MLTYLWLVTLPPAFAALTVFASAGKVPSLLAPIARVVYAVPAAAQPRALPDGLPAGRAAVTTLLHHGLVVARSAPTPARDAPEPRSDRPVTARGSTLATPTAPGTLTYEAPAAPAAAPPVAIVTPVEQQTERDGLALDRQPIVGGALPAGDAADDGDEADVIADINAPISTTTQP